ncbi:MAG TPA: DUF4956 domain-containing protein [Pyrinomonadaceae bacterium]|jgi:uncharacterized membrane protein YhiD involved in acid resistance
MNRQNGRLIAIILAVFVVSALGSYYFFGRPPLGRPPVETASSATPQPSLMNQASDNPAQDTQSQTAKRGESSFFTEIFGAGAGADPSHPEKWTTVILRVMVRLTLAALLTSMLAFRPRKFAVLFKRNLFVAQTQILLAVVASALMMVVGDNAARAFGIFAAVSLVRFRTNIRDPKEITVLLVSLAVGLATGVGRWELAAVLSLFVLVLLWALEYREQEMISRTMELKVTTRNLVETHAVIKGILKQHDFSSELRTLNREDADEPLGEIVFCVEMNPLVSTDILSDEILSADHTNIDTIEWSQQKSNNAYQ